MRNYFPDPSGYAEYRRKQDDYAVVKAFAEKLHAKLCRYSHVDQCTWDYEGNNWLAWTHVKYFSKAHELLSSGVPENAILDIIDVSRKL